MLASLQLVLAFCGYCSSKLLQYMLELQPHVIVAAAAKYVGATATMWVQQPHMGHLLQDGHPIENLQMISSNLVQSHTSQPTHL